MSHTNAIPKDQLSSATKKNAKQPAVTIHRRVKGKGGKMKIVTEEVTAQHWQVELGPAPDPTKDYAVWLQYQKQKWRIQRAQRQLRKEMVSTEAS